LRRLEGAGLASNNGSGWRQFEKPIETESNDRRPPTHRPSGAVRRAMFKRF